jgi:hypothetical protein
MLRRRNPKLTMAETLATAYATAETPGPFWAAMRSAPKGGGVAPVEGFGGSGEVKEYPEQYDEPYAQKAYDSGRYELVDGEWRGLTGALKGRVVPEHKLRATFGG